jgi:hypothetical protein
MSFQSRPSEESGSLTTFPKSERQYSVVVIVGGKREREREGQLICVVTDSAT